MIGLRLIALGRASGKFDSAEPSARGAEHRNEQEVQKNGDKQGQLVDVSA